MEVSFNVSKKGNEVTFINTSRKVPEGSTYLWDFGVDGAKSYEKNPKKVVYENEGFYLVSLQIIPPSTSGEVSITVEETLGISKRGYTTLSDSIYNLINHYIPDDLLKYITRSDKKVYIEKWQLYLQPIVNHEVPVDEYSNEFAYYALENQLIMELAAYDWMMTGVMNLMRSVSNTIETSTSSGTGNNSDDNQSQNGNVKKITTGPSEVEFFNTTISGDEAASLTKSLNSALQPGGLLDSIKYNICMLAERLDIYLPLCGRMYSEVVVPKVVNKRDPGLLGGPNPKFPINK